MKKIFEVSIDITLDIFDDDELVEYLSDRGFYVYEYEPTNLVFEIYEELDAILDAHGILNKQYVLRLLCETCHNKSLSEIIEKLT